MIININQGSSTTEFSFCIFRPQLGLSQPFRFCLFSKVDSKASEVCTVFLEFSTVGFHHKLTVYIIISILCKLHEDNVLEFIISCGHQRQSTQLFVTLDDNISVAHSKDTKCTIIHNLIKIIKCTIRNSYMTYRSDVKISW